MGDRLKPTLQQLEALANLRGNSDFAKFLEVSQEYERELLDRLVCVADPAMIHQTQGAIVALRTLREIYVSAPASIEKSRK